MQGAGTADGTADRRLHPQLFEMRRRHRNRPGFHLAGQREAPRGIAHGFEDHVLEAHIGAVARTHQGERLLLVVGMMAAALGGDRRQADRPVVQIEATVAPEIDQGFPAFHDGAVLQKLCLGWGICPAGVIPPQQDMAELVASVIRSGLDGGLIEETDVVTIVHGFLPGVSGTTNAVQVLDMREYLAHVKETHVVTAEK